MVNYRKIVFFYVPVMPICVNYDKRVHGSVNNLLRMQGICSIQGLSPYRAVNTLHFGYKTQSVNDV